MAIDNWQNLYGPGVHPVSNPPGFPTAFQTSLSNSLPTTRVELSISCRGLRDMDILSKSDPQCFIYVKDSYQDRYFEVGRTEEIKDTLNPDFVTKIQLNYNFEMVQMVRFDVWDIDPDGRDFLGRMETTLADMVAFKGRQFVKPLRGTKKNQDYGQIMIVVEEVIYNKLIITFTPSCQGIRKGFLSKRNTFLQVWKTNEDGTNSVVYKTEVYYSSTSPSFREIALRISSLCSGDFDRNIQLDVMQYSYSGNHRLLGSGYTTVNNMIKGGTECNTLTLSKKKDSTSNQNKNRGIIQLKNIVLKEETSFLDYIKGGTELHFAVAIDFTASNGVVTDKSSLHYIDASGKPNPYEIALKAVGDIISHYDPKGMYASFGFGSIVPPAKVVSHHFPLNGNPNHPYCNGVSDLLACYKNILNQVIFYGPTNFAPVIEATAEIAKQNQNGQNYFILLIITDGIICDMIQTKKAIIKASHLPLSIIIVGVGNADFTAMDELDSDDKLLSVDRMRAVRDIVQFVPLNRFLRHGNWVHSMVDLAKEVLFEVPDQVLSYMKMRGFKPKEQRITSPSAPSFTYKFAW